MLNGEYRLGAHTTNGIVDINEAKKEYPTDLYIPESTMALIESGKEGLHALETFIATLPLHEQSNFLYDELQLEWAPCVPEPKKIICVGLNYRKHAEETNASIPSSPILFNKFHNALAGHRDNIEIPNETAELDYEAELAIVIGQRAKHVSKENALEYVFGYTVANDLSARDLQMRTGQWLLGKSCDGFAPLGPYLVTADEVGDPNNLTIQTEVNGEMRQNSNTEDMIFYCDEIVSYISKHMTLEPGDIILTGTPEGVVLGLPKEQRVYLQPGDEVKVIIEKLGTLHNVFVKEVVKD